MHYIKIIEEKHRIARFLYEPIGVYDEETYFVRTCCSFVGSHQGLAEFGKYSDALLFAEAKASLMNLELIDETKQGKKRGKGAKNQGRKAK